MSSKVSSSDSSVGVKHFGSNIRRRSSGTNCLYTSGVEPSKDSPASLKEGKNEFKQCDLYLLKIHRNLEISVGGRVVKALDLRNVRNSELSNGSNTAWVRPPAVAAIFFCRQFSTPLELPPNRAKFRIQPFFELSDFLGLFRTVISCERGRWRRRQKQLD
jgi:hypothetical protein